MTQVSKGTPNHEQILSAAVRCDHRGAECQP